MLAADDGWFADDSLWELSYPFMFGERKLAAGMSEVEALLELTGKKSGAALDLACGPGRHSLPLAYAGFRVTGVDRSKFLLQKARERASDPPLDIEWVQADMREFARPASFDLALNLFTSFGFFESDADNRQVLDNVRESLRENGRFVLDVMGKELLAKIFEPSGVTSVPGVGMHVARRAIVESFTQIDNEWTFVMDSGRVARHRIRHWIYSGRELELMLRDAGFSDVSLFGDFTGAPYRPGAERLVLVGTR